ncbi:hypothetical protein [Kaistia sp. MMO-174]|uniref:hypothetical protein n=1 Tax=Kaistia sp. MMO-174 TaxID=3081256 RepID=UPI0030169A17
MEKTDYIVTDKAGSHVAGKRVTAGDPISLTEAQARYELLLESIRPADEKAPVEPASKPARSAGK